MSKNRTGFDFSRWTKYFPNQIKLTCQEYSRKPEQYVKQTLTNGGFRDNVSETRRFHNASIDEI